MCTTTVSGFAEPDAARRTVVRLLASFNPFGAFLSVGERAT
jgi:hypothetical protein